MNWKTRVTELLGCRYPILQGALAKHGSWKFAAAVANAGAHGLITSCVARSPDKLREYIRRCRDDTDGSFGVNLSIGLHSNIEEMLAVCIEEGVPIETAGYRPDSLAPRIKEGGVKWIHKAARVRDAVHAEKLGVDAVIIVGLEGTGFKSVEQLPTMLTTILAKRELKVPVIVAGGIGDARGFLGALAMGADGVMMGTAFMATEECPISGRAKGAIVNVSGHNLELRQQILGPIDPKAYAEVIKLRGEVSLDKWLPMLERVLIKEPDWKQPLRTTEERVAQLKLVSLAAGVIDCVVPVKELIDGIVNDAEGLVQSYQFLKPS